MLVEQLRAAAASREHVGFACGVLAERYELSPTTAWSLLQRLSQNTNTKVRTVASLVHADLDDGIAIQDAEVARTVNAQIAAAKPLLTDVVVEDEVDPA